MARREKRNIIGLIFVIIGILLILDNVTFLPNIIPHWVWTWQFLIIGIGVFMLLSGKKGPAYVMILVGSLFLFPRVFHGIWDSFQVLFHNTSNLFWYLIIIGVGLFLLFKGRRRHDDYTDFRNTFSDDPLDDRGGEPDNIKDETNQDTYDQNTIDDVSVFGGNKKLVISKNFKGGEILTMFGESVIDLTQASMAPGTNVIEVFAMFGGWKLIVPPNWLIRSEATVIFGGINDKRTIHANVVKDNTRQLVIKGFVMFGGGELRSY